VLGFSPVLNPIKWQDFLEEGGNGRNAFRTGVKIHFSQKKIWILGLGALNSLRGKDKLGSVKNGTMQKEI